VAEDLGRLLGSLGAEVVTGGYQGLMAAVSRGARAGGGYVVGLPMSAWTHLTPNEWNTELRWATDYPTRLAAILDTDCVIALDGGVGTLSELAVVWAAAQTEPDAPLIVTVGARWDRLIKGLRRDLIADDRDHELIRTAESAAQAVETLLAEQRTGSQPGRARG
jgi:uncharacterized protein (TIGR00725 family)